MLGGITARFECIVQCDPYPYIEWYKSDTDEPLRSGYGKYYIEFRNGVCRLTIPDAISSNGNWIGMDSAIWPNAILLMMFDWEIARFIFRWCWHLFVHSYESFGDGGYSGRAHRQYGKLEFPQIIIDYLHIPNTIALLFCVCYFCVIFVPTTLGEDECDWNTVSHFVQTFGQKSKGSKNLLYYSVHDNFYEWKNFFCKSILFCKN